jgi:pyridoxal phosphate enzyme (YggS family)
MKVIIFVILFRMEKNEREKKLESNYQNLLNEIKKTKKENNITKEIKLISVSKKRSIEDIKVIYDLGVRIFGENYVNELLEKKEKLGKDIEWHLIGHLQSNKVKKLLQNIPNVIIESVDSVKIAEEINKHAQGKIKVYVEVNISGSESKTGADLKIIDDICKVIIEKCNNLELIGIMSLGDVGNKEQFENMVKIKNDICDKYHLDKSKFIASFGTSQDYIEAILSGSDEIRVGHQIFEV